MSIRTVRGRWYQPQIPEWHRRPQNRNAEGQGAVGRKAFPDLLPYDYMHISHENGRMQPLQPMVFYRFLVAGIHIHHASENIEHPQRGYSPTAQLTVAIVKDIHFFSI